MLPSAATGGERDALAMMRGRPKTKPDASATQARHRPCQTHKPMAGPPPPGQREQSQKPAASARYRATIGRASQTPAARAAAPHGKSATARRRRQQQTATADPHHQQRPRFVTISDRHPSTAATATHCRQRNTLALARSQHGGARSLGQRGELTVPPPRAGA